MTAFSLGRRRPIPAGRLPKRLPSRAHFSVLTSRAATTAVQISARSTRCFRRGSYFNEASLIGPQNLMDLQPGVEFALTKSLKLTTSCDFIWRESLDDGVYGVALNLQVPAGASHERYVAHIPAPRSRGRRPGI